MSIEKYIKEFEKQFFTEYLNKPSVWNKPEEMLAFLRTSLTSLLDNLVEDIEKVKQGVQKQTGSYKYDDQYDDCINIINSHK